MANQQQPNKSTNNAAGQPTSRPAQQKPGEQIKSPVSADLGADEDKGMKKPAGKPDVTIERVQK